MEITQYQHFPEELKEQWNQLLDKSITCVPFLRFEYLQDWWQTKGGGEWAEDSQLALFAAHQAGELVGIAPFFIANHEGKKKLLLLGSIEISDYLDLIVTEQKAAEFIEALLTYIQEKVKPQAGIEAVDLYNLIETSPAVKLLQAAAAPAGINVHMERLQQCPFISLPGDWEIYLESIDKKQRHEIRRKMRRAAESDLPVQLYITSKKENLDEDINSFFSLMAQDPEKDKFLTDPMRQQFRKLMHWTFDEGCLQLAFLTIGDEKAAVYLNLDCMNRIWVYNSGLDRRFMDYSPGWVLLGYLLQWANENKREVFDFMRGNEDYKYKFGAVDRTVIRVTLE